MPTYDQLEIIKPDGNIEFYKLDSGTGIANIGSDLKNDIILENSNIRPFHAFLDYRQLPARVTILEQEAGLLSVKPPEILPNFGTVEFEGYILIFLEGDHQTPGESTPEPEPGSSSQNSQPSSLMTIPFPDQVDDDIVIQLSARAFTAEVEETTTFQVVVTNSAALKAAFEVEVVGLNADWATISHPHLVLDSNDHQAVSITIKLPRLPLSRAGIHHFAIKVTSSAFPERYCQQRATLTVNPYYDFTVSGLSPKRRSVSWSKLSARFDISLTNTSNSFARFRLEGDDDEAMCNFEFQIPGEATQLTRHAEFLLLPNESAVIPIQVIPSSNIMVSFSQQTQSFVITTRMLQGDHLPRSVLGQLTRKPLVGPGMLTMLTLALVIFGSLFLTTIAKQTTYETLPLIGRRADLTQDPVIMPAQRLSVEESSEPSLDKATTKDKKQMTYEAMFQEIGSQYNLDWRVLEALAYRESHMDYLAVGSASDMGLMQIIPSTWNEWAPKANVYDPFDPYSNVTVGAAYLAYVRDYCVQKGRPEPVWMLVGYNWGPERLGRFFDNGGTWEKIPLPQRQYATTILEMASNRALSSAPFDEFYSDIVLE